MSIPHSGIESLPGVRESDFAQPSYVTFPWGYSDLFARNVYADAANHGVSVVATPYSRLFIDVNRARDDFECSEGAVKSQRGVFRTHMINDQPIFAAPLTKTDAELRLRCYYDPYHEKLEEIIDDTYRRFDRVVLLDAHTGSPNGMRNHEVIIGTRHGQTASSALVELAREAFQIHGFSVEENVPGYSGGQIVRRHSANGTGRAVQALQIEINSGLLMTTPRKELIKTMMRGQIPPSHQGNIDRARASVACLLEQLAGG